jgi:cytochrome c peroxidase
MLRKLVLVVLMLSGLDVVAQDGSPVRLKPREELSAQAYTAEAAKLREAYAKPVGEWPKATVEPTAKFTEFGPIPAIEHPKANPFKKEKADLGKALFFDGRLSGSGHIACATCHDPDLAWSDGRTTSFGHGRKALKRNAPSIMNSGHFTTLFWDGRADSLEDQARKVLANHDEMQAVEKLFAPRLKETPGYPEAFRAAFGDDAITLDRVVQALACFERTVVGGKSRFDQALQGNLKTWTDAEVRGLHLFRQEARCINCHNGPLLTDGQMHDVGLSYYGRKFEDLGRYEITKDEKQVGQFRTPSLRNIGRTGPYMHNGLFELDEILRLYNAGMPTIRRTEKFQNDTRFPVKSALLKPLGLNKQDLADLTAFLMTLNEPIRKIRPPELVGGP